MCVCEFNTGMKQCDIFVVCTALVQCRKGYLFAGLCIFIAVCKNPCGMCVSFLLQADYFGIAGTVHVLLTGEYMSVQRNPGNGLYHPSKPFPRYFIPRTALLILRCMRVCVAC